MYRFYIEGIANFKSNLLHKCCEKYENLSPYMHVEGHIMQ